MIDILLFPDVGSTIPKGREGRRGGEDRREQNKGALGAMKSWLKFLAKWFPIQIAVDPS